MQANKRYFQVYFHNETWRKESVYCFCTNLPADDALGDVSTQAFYY